MFFKSFFYKQPKNQTFLPLSPPFFPSLTVHIIRAWIWTWIQHQNSHIAFVSVVPDSSLLPFHTISNLPAMSAPMVSKPNLYPGALPVSKTNHTHLTLCLTCPFNQQTTACLCTITSYSVADIFFTCYFLSLSVLSLALLPPSLYYAMPFLFFSLLIPCTLLVLSLYMSCLFYPFNWYSLSYLSFQLIFPLLSVLSIDFPCLIYPFN